MCHASVLHSQSWTRFKANLVAMTAAKTLEPNSDTTTPTTTAAASTDGGTSERQKVSIREPPSMTMYPSLPSSVTMAVIPSDHHGEHLTNLSETEWEGGEQAYPSDFLNLIKNDERVQVFAPPEKAADYQLKLEEKRRKKRLERLSRKMEEAMGKGAKAIESFAELVEEITKMLNEDKHQNKGVQVHISVKVIGPDGKQYTATTVTSAEK